MYLYGITSRKYVESISYMESNETHWMNLSLKTAPYNILLSRCRMRAFACLFCQPRGSANRNRFQVVQCRIAMLPKSFANLRGVQVASVDSTFVVPGKRTPFFWNIAAWQNYSITSSRAVTPENQPSLHKHRRFLSARWFGLNIS